MNKDIFTASTEETGRLRLESNRPSFRQAVLEEKGCRCVNCGSEENVEYHHIVPVLLGGTNNPSNIVPLCHACHAAAHRGQHISHYRREFNKSGRKTKLSDDAVFPIFEKYIRCEIGMKEAREMLGLPSGRHMCDMVQYKRYVEQLGIRKFRNNIDIRIAKGSEMCDGSVVGEVWYTDGRHEQIIYHGDSVPVPKPSEAGRFRKRRVMKTAQIRSVS